MPRGWSADDAITRTSASPAFAVGVAAAPTSTQSTNGAAQRPFVRISRIAVGWLRTAAAPRSQSAFAETAILLGAELAPRIDTSWAVARRETLVRRGQLVAPGVLESSSRL